MRRESCFVIDLPQTEFHWVRDGGNLGTIKRRKRATIALQMVFKVKTMVKSFIENVHLWEISLLMGRVSFWRREQSKKYTEKSLRSYNFTKEKNSYFRSPELPQPTLSWLSRAASSIKPLRYVLLFNTRPYHLIKFNDKNLL